MTPDGQVRITCLTSLVASLATPAVALTAGIAPGQFTGTLARGSCKPGTFVATSSTGRIVTDDGNGVLVGHVKLITTRTLDYTTGAYNFTFDDEVLSVSGTVLYWGGVLATPDAILWTLPFRVQDASRVQVHMSADKNLNLMLVSDPALALADLFLNWTHLPRHYGSPILALSRTTPIRELPAVGFDQVVVYLDNREAIPLNFSFSLDITRTREIKSPGPVTTFLNSWDATPIDNTPIFAGSMDL